MHHLKPLSKDAIQPALAKAERYRLLNEPGEAESICLDVLEIDPANQPAQVALILALTDQFGTDAGAYGRARALVPALSGAYERAYYAGIVAERRAKAQYASTGHAAVHGVHDWLLEAMAHFEEAERLRPAGNDDALLRWNACARFLMQHPELRSASTEREEIEMLE
jgi:hypothetical protein